MFIAFSDFLSLYHIFLY